MDPIAARLAEWLRRLAELVEAGELPVEDVAQALFAGDDYKICSVLSEHGDNGGNERAERLLADLPVIGLQESESDG